MVLDRIPFRRRGFLSSLIGVSMAVAGCSELQSSETKTQVPQQTRLSTMDPPPEYSNQARGSREHGWLYRIADEDRTVTSTSYTPVGSALTYGFVSTPARRIPILTAHVRLQNDTAGETTALKFTTRGREERNIEPLLEVRTDGSTDANQLYEEVYLNEALFGTSFRASFGDGTFESYVKVSGGQGTLHHESTAGLVYEVI